MTASFPSTSFPWFRALALVGVPALIGLALPAQAVTSPLSLPETGVTEVLLAQEAITETVLFFETESTAVRIYRRGSDLFMNLYNKKTGIVEVNNTPAELIPSTRDQTVYKNSRGEADRFARVTVLAESELEIVAPNGTVVLKEPGYATVVGVPSGQTDFQGNNFAPGTSALVIAARYANIRQNPDADSEVLTNAPRRDLVDVVDRVGNPRDGFIWYKVLYNGATGWVRGDLLQPA